MSRTFAYCRVSTNEQTAENQIREIEAKGFAIEPHRIVTETISGSSPASERPGFKTLLMKLEMGDCLIVTKLDRLGRDVTDINRTMARLYDLGIEVHCLALSGFELQTAIGKMMFNIITAFSQFERELLIERTHAGLKRAKAQGKTLGRPKALSKQENEAVLVASGEGKTTSEIARRFNVSRATVMRAIVAMQ